MREQGWCSHCNYPIERRCIFRPVRTEVPFSFYVSDAFIPPTMSHDRIETFCYVAFGKEIVTCPGCGSVLLTGDDATDMANMRLERELRGYYKP